MDSFTCGCLSSSSVVIARELMCSITSGTEPSVGGILFLVSERRANQLVQRGVNDD